MRPLLLLLLLLLPAPAFASQDKAEQLIEQLRTGDARERKAALTALSELGDKARPALRRALRSGDPDLRFHALFLLHLPDGRLERAVRDVVESAAGNNLTVQGSALQAYKKLLATATPETPGRLVQLIRRRARNKKAKPLAVVVSLDLLRELIARKAKAKQVTPADARQLASLLDLDLRSGFHSLVLTLGALPFERALPALRAVATQGSPLARARAARVLGETCPPGKAQLAKAALVPLLRHRAANVRLAAVQALDQLVLSSKDMVPVVRLAMDKAPRVAEEALRIAGERKLAFVREACEKLARDSKRSLRLRKQAIRTLGLIGEAGAAAALKVVGAGEDRELTVLSAWALGALRAKGALEVLLPLIGSSEYSQEQMLYQGLARAGGSNARDALLGFATMPDPMPVSRDAVILLRGRATRAIKATALLNSPFAARDLADFARKKRALRTSHPGPTIAEVRLAIEALADRGGDEASILLGKILVDPTAALARPTVLAALTRRGMPSGHYALKVEVVEQLKRTVQHGRNPRRRAEAADALAKVDPGAARLVLQAQLQRQGRWNRQRVNRDLARSLARAGDPSYIDRYALPFSRTQVRSALPDRRVSLLNNVGIDLLYARRFDEALSVFRRMVWSTPDHQLAAYNAACGYALKGQVEPALRWLRRSVQLGYKNARHMEADSDLTVLRKDPRFKRLLARLYLAEETQMPVPKFLPPR